MTSQNRTCSITGCADKHLARGLCNNHYRRMKKFGDPLAGGPFQKLRPRGLSMRGLFSYFMPGQVPESGCWDWPHTLTSAGYGKTWFQGREIGAHVLSYRVHNGEVPNGLVVRHTCDRPSCVQPSHLVLGTYAENTHDAVDRGRMAKGERTGAAKLTSADVIEIRSLAGTMTKAALGRKFGVSDVAISKVIYRETWRHIS